MEFKLSKRQNQYLKLIIEEFIETGNPVSSQLLIGKNQLNISSATVRSEMYILEKLNLIQKINTSSGRIPSTIGYQYYVDNLIDIANQDYYKLKTELSSIFSKRFIGIDNTINEAINQIAQITGLTLITSEASNNELLKSIQLVPINNKTATIVIVTSTGSVKSKSILINEKININDLKIAIRLFQERLIDTPLRELTKKVLLLKELLIEKVMNFELIIQEFANKVFNFHFNNDPKIYGEANIIKQSHISRQQLVKIISLLSKKSIWDSIESQSRNSNLRIQIDDNTSIISKKIITNNKEREISIVGSNRTKYKQAIQILNLLENHLNNQN